MATSEKRKSSQKKTKAVHFDPSLNTKTKRTKKKSTVQPLQPLRTRGGADSSATTTGTNNNGSGTGGATNNASNNNNGPGTGGIPAGQMNNGGNNTINNNQFVLTTDQIQQLLNGNQGGGLTAQQINGIIANASGSRGGLPQANATEPVWSGDPSFLDDDGNDKTTAEGWKDGLTKSSCLNLSFLHINGLRAEGLRYPIQFAEYNQEEMQKQLFKNLRDRGVTFTAQSQKLVCGFCNFMAMIRDCNFTIADSHFNVQSIEQHSVQHKSMIASIDDKSTPTRLAKVADNTDFLSWVDNAYDTFAKMFTPQGIPLGYIIRISDTVEKDPTKPDDCITPGKCYSASSGSLTAFLVERYTHAGPYFDSDNKKVFDILWTAFQGTSHQAILEPFRRVAHGRAAWKAILVAHGGKQRFEETHRQLKELVSKPKAWSSKGTKSLKLHCSGMRDAFRRMDSCCDNTNAFTKMGGREKVNLLIASINSSDSQLDIAIAEIKREPDKYNDFEVAANALMAVDPISANISASTNAHGRVIISAVTTGGSSDNLPKRGPKTGVDLRWHLQADYKKLPKDQRDELRDWMRTPEGKQKIKADQKQLKNDGKLSGGGKSGKRKNGNISGLSKNARKKLKKKNEKLFDEAFDATVAGMKVQPPSPEEVAETPSVSSTKANFMEEFKKNVKTRLFSKSKGQG